MNHITRLEDLFSFQKPRPTRNSRVTVSGVCPEFWLSDEFSGLFTLR
jgi:hypothetical protein